MVLIQSNARRFLAVACCIVATGCQAITSEARGDLGPHPSGDHFSTGYLQQDSESDNGYPVLQVVDVQGVSDGDGADSYSQVQPARADDDINDPWEELNRVVFSFNEVVYDGLIGPFADAHNMLPSEARTVVSSFFSNLGEPIVFINDILQGEAERAMTTFTRFAMNSTLGFGGLADVASAAGVKSHNEDFGQTLAVWGVGDGFYLVLPILGPSNPRDAFGQYLIDPLLDPVNLYLDNQCKNGFIVPRAFVAGFTGFASVRDESIKLKNQSDDYYAVIRSLYRQNRQAEISNVGAMKVIPVEALIKVISIPHSDMIPVEALDEMISNAKEMNVISPEGGMMEVIPVETLIKVISIPHSDMIPRSTLEKIISENKRTSGIVSLSGQDVNQCLVNPRSAALPQARHSRRISD